MFEVLNKVSTKLEGAITDNLTDAIYLAETDPTTLVYTAKIIEWEVNIYMYIIEGEIREKLFLILYIVDTCT